MKIYFYVILVILSSNLVFADFSASVDDVYYLELENGNIMFLGLNNHYPFDSYIITDSKLCYRNQEELNYDWEVYRNGQYVTMQSKVLLKDIPEKYLSELFSCIANSTTLGYKINPNCELFLWRTLSLEEVMSSLGTFSIIDSVYGNLSEAQLKEKLENNKEYKFKLLEVSVSYLPEYICKENDGFVRHVTQRALFSICPVSNFEFSEFRKKIYSQSEVLLEGLSIVDVEPKGTPCHK
ncbi:MAG: hypothetical protein ABIA04_09745 [Pseudomonadota bacterium]